MNGNQRCAHKRNTTNELQFGSRERVAGLSLGNVAQAYASRTGCGLEPQERVALHQCMRADINFHSLAHDFCDGKHAALKSFTAAVL